MRRLPLLGLALALGLALTACEGMDNGGGVGGMSREQTIGTGGGAVAGGLAGYLLTKGAGGALIGAAAGAVIGNRLGNYLEGDEETAAAKAAARAAELPTGERVTWEKTGATFQTQASGWASPVNEPFNRDGRTCRRIEQSATKGGTTTEDSIILCSGADGWVPA